MPFFTELRRRKVIRVAGLYIVVGWVLIQVAETVFPALSLPDWSVTLVVVLILLGLPLALVLAWAYDLTPDGVRAGAASAGDSPPPADAGTAGRPASPTPERAVAVLPFANLSADPENEFFSDGVAEEILDALSRVTTLRVAARTAAWAFKGRNPELAEIAEKLQVDTVVEGSVRRADSAIRITAQLIDVASGFQLWSEKFDRELADVFAVQEEIARSVVEALRVRVTPRESDALGRAPTADVDAYEYYLRGRWHMHRLGVRSLHQAKEMFERAIAADPTFARAHAGLSAALLLEYTWFIRRPDLLEAARDASQKALEYGPELPETRTAAGYVHTVAGRFEEAEREFERAIALDPGHFEAYFFYGRTLVSQGRMAEAAEVFATAHRVRPEDYQSLVLQLLGMRSAGLDGQEDVARTALRVIERHLDLVPDDPRAYYLGAHALIGLDRHDQAREWLDRAAELDPGDPGVGYNVACGYARLGDGERALDILERNVDRGAAPPSFWVRNDPDFDSVRDTRRFARLLERLEAD